jgi:hypothetical protein
MNVFRTFILLLYIIIIQSPIFSFGQNGFIISGKVKDIETGYPIYNASVKEKATKNGTTTNENGYFFLKVSKLPVTLEFSHVAYKKHIYSCKNNNQLKIDMFLQKQVDSLPVINISAHKIVNLVDKKFFDVVDYEFYNDSILLLAYSYKDVINPWLILINSNGDTLFRAAVKNDGKLYRDCLGNIHLVTKELAYQLFFENNHLNLLYPINPDTFHMIIDPCITEINNKYFIKQWSLHNQILSYSIVNAADTSKKIVRIISDDKAIRMLADFDRFNSMGKSAPTESDNRFEEMCFFDPIFAPLLKIKDKIVIFNFIDSKIEIYNNSGELYRETPISFHKTKGWKEDIISDEITGKVYAVFRGKGFTKIREINLETGIPSIEITIPDFKFIENIKVRNGNLYFLYRINSPLELMKLYKMSI